MAAAFWVSQTMSDFGRSLGFDDLTFDERGMLHLAFDELGTLGLEQQDKQVLIYLMRYFSHAEPATLLKSLQICHHRLHDFDWCQAALMKDHHLAIATTLPHQDFQLSRLESVIDQLATMHDEVASISYR
ncbi:CesT family type III secretion system chaperone [Thalassoglobus sp. JC818]|uniref:CesT family type III secretion system chaperone n=1 Tax=Thalassoglobus sp. JC818 TaxID=3232136 RepID=UPI00345B23CC